MAVEEVEYALVINLTETKAEIDWIRAGRLQQKCEAGDDMACKQLADMQTKRMYAHDEIMTSKKEK